ncbi:MAG: non-canonical purine NTP diphosphatase [Cyclobacteriaceae bacterium]|nr:non-canonical purine NTP diphosphatase [Cyclobacteriaceae bacterium]MCB9238237.1 non-canonical purine NTP diphosphatase [Flammeovirgaceae bacterium]MCB0498961.1 non-canonical purine NTP diphosphatase [Cyclobacteriaceae bacterium]MCO5272162.1 non-canonical purine NTP diphosphatase [Cyclobacteriaceae bacterium]MCW5902723.1 non-canonical purine NTP diphosphatase [Cyclobacteriaceae bacterium]
MELCFATNNQHKLDEVSRLLGGAYTVLGLKAIGCDQELPEEQDTLEGNSLQKARFVHDHYHIDCFADDTGLEVEALNGAPGVYSARYAGPQRNSEDNMALLLENLKGKANRRARFRTVITLVRDGQAHQFEGIARGEVLESKRGARGFGYDPLFLPEGLDKSMAELTADEKNAISHRGEAIRKLVAFLKQR